MTPEQFERVKSLFQSALDLPETERTAFIHQSCPADPNVRDEVLRLLAEHASTPTSFLAPPGPESLLHRAAHSLASQTPAYTGQLLARRYLVEREIGRGGSGIAYLARDQRLHARPVVLKFLHTAWDDHDRICLHFLQEIEALSRLTHPAVVGVLDVGQAPDGRSFLVMEYVDGLTLRSRLRTGPLSFPEAASIVSILCDALETAHRSGIIHRDIKPENIMLLPRGENVPAKLIDFGIAKIQTPTAPSDTAAVVGTVHYLAPEQLMGKSGPSSDVYALGVVAYEMLTGHRPFEPDTPFRLYELQKAAKILPPSRLHKGIPAAASRAILRALSFRPENRQSSPRAFAAEFQAKAKFRLARPTPRLWAPAVAILLLLIPAPWFLNHLGWASYDPVIAYDAPWNLEDFGFRPRLDVVEHVSMNPERTGYEAIRLLTSEQGYYYHKLTRAQAYAAVRKGWKLDATMQSIQGATCAGIELTPAGDRYDLCLIRDAPDHQLALLTTEIGRALDGPRFALPDAKPTWHNYQLVFDPHARSARLLIDGIERLASYRGHREYLEGWGLTLGAFAYRSLTAEARFKRVRFQINP
jgi:predicted Ser/Thr protein kinase